MHILNAAVAAGAGDAYAVRKCDRSTTRNVQFTVAGTASVKLQGRMQADAAWVDLGTAATASGVQAILLMPEVRANVTSWTSGAVDVYVDAQDA